MGLKIEQAAFRDGGGVFHGTGSCHDTSALPEGFVPQDEGFITTDGTFLTRDEATASLAADHSVQSEELDLAKKTPPTFPSLGMPDDRRETPFVDARGAKVKGEAMVNAGVNAQKDIYGKMSYRYDGPADRLRTRANGIGGLSVTTPKQNISFASNGKPATKMHEDMHNLFGRVQQKYGKPARDALTRNIVWSMPWQSRHAVWNVADTFNSNPGKAQHHEEMLAHMISYLNDPVFRKEYAGYNSVGGTGLIEHDRAMKAAYKHFLHVSQGHIPAEWMMDPEHMERQAKAAMKGPDVDLNDPATREAFLAQAKEKSQREYEHNTAKEAAYRQYGDDLQNWPSNVRSTFFKSEALAKADNTGGYLFDGPHAVDDTYNMTVVHPEVGTVGALKFASKSSDDPEHPLHKVHSIIAVNVHPDHVQNGVLQRMLSIASDFARKTLGARGLLLPAGPEELMRSESDQETSAEHVEHEWYVEFRRWLKARKKNEPVDADGLEKNKPTPTFPKLGVPDDRRETPIIDTEPQRKLKMKQIANTSVKLQRYPVQPHPTYVKDLQNFTGQSPEQAKVMASRLARDQFYGDEGTADRRSVIRSAVNQRNLNGAAQNNVGGATTNSFSLGLGMRSGYFNGLKGPGATQLHEDLHNLFQRITEKYGEQGRFNLSRNLLNHLYIADPQAHEALRSYISVVRPDAQEKIMASGGKPSLGAGVPHEEHIAHLLNYLNDPAERNKFFAVTKADENIRRDMDVKLKRAYAVIQRAAKSANPLWVLNPSHKQHAQWAEIERQMALGKAEDDLSTLLQRHGNLNDNTSDAHHEVARRMAGYTPELEPEFMAARFLAGGTAASDEAIRVALTLYDTDFELAALRAYGLPRNSRYRDMLRSVMNMQRATNSHELSKNTMEVDAIPRIVEPATKSAEDVAEMLQRAFAANAVHHVKLDGKHSKGTAIATDPDSGKRWLIKPGSGKMSPSMGVAQEVANQSQREVAFYKIAEAAGLGDYLPRAELLKLDGQLVAVMELLGTDYKGLDKVRQREGLNARTVFEPYRKNGDLFRWAMLDWVLGNPDRHANNVMIDENHDIKLIDHGSAFAGTNFDPADDTKSFVPFYLRAWMTNNWHDLEAPDREREMPSPDHEVASEVGEWIGQLPVPQIEEILSEYGIMREPTLYRLKNLTTEPEEKRVQLLLSFWSGAMPTQYWGGL